MCTAYTCLQRSFGVAVWREKAVRAPVTLQSRTNQRVRARKSIYELTERVLLWLRGMELGDQDNNNR
ncbi:hypothetical protein J2T15_005793 [Paenibacillus harenae]|uniref:Uncharacterized protein n=1 Tax=Paenibacillus harenae TaxID=306543 RepID=A0ABT9U9J1_PAEHA|nr:hypothetical protein [Paenibacillus harenae]